MTNPEQLSEDSALEAQQELLETSLPLVFDAYDAATTSGMRQPVVFLLDCEDAIGREIAEGWLSTEAVRAAVEQQQLLAADVAEAGSQTTVFAHAFPLEDCRTEVPEVFPYLTPVFSADSPRDGFLVIAVTCGGASALTVPLSAREEG